MLLRANFFSSCCCSTSTRWSVPAGPRITSASPPSAVANQSLQFSRTRSSNLCSYLFISFSFFSFLFFWQANRLLLLLSGSRHSRDDALASLRVTTTTTCAALLVCWLLSSRSSPVSFCRPLFRSRPSAFFLSFFLRFSFFQR